MDLIKKLSSVLNNWTYRIESHPYHTAFVAGLFSESSLIFPNSLDYLLKNQHADGSWGSNYPNIHERLITTAAVLRSFVQNKRDTRLAFRQGIAYLNKTLPLIIQNPDTQLVGYGLILTSCLKDLISYLNTKLVPLIDQIESKISPVGDEIQDIDISNTYYCWSLEGFTLSYLSDLNHEKMLQSDGSVVGSVSASAELYKITEDSMVKQRLLKYLQSMQNSDGGFGNFSGDTLDILFALFPLFGISLDIDNLIEDTMWTHFTEVENTLQEDGLPFSTSFPTGDLDVTVAAMYMRHSLNRPIPEIYWDIIDERSNVDYSTYIRLISSSTRSGQVIREIDVLAKVLYLAKQYNKDRHTSEIINLIVQDLRSHTIRSRWHIFDGYTLCNISKILPEIKDEKIIELIKEKVDKIIEEVNQELDLNCIESGNYMKFVFLLYFLEETSESMNWEFNAISRAKLYGSIRLNYNEINHLPQMWISKVLYKTGFMDKCWSLAALLKYESNHKNEIST